MHPIKFKKFTLSDKDPLVVFCGPCVIESEEQTLRAAEALSDIFASLDCNWVFKSSYDKANRTSIDSYRGPGLDEGLRILEKVKTQFDVPILSDIHSPDEVASAKQVLDVMQIPAFLSRQTDLIVAAGESQTIVNIKKGQFMAPWDIEHSVKKVLATGNKNIILTDRGTSFGYNNLVTDIRAMPIMKAFGFPVCFDATHSTQLPGGHSSYSGGQRQFCLPLTLGALAAGADCLYIEAHENPSQAKSDAATQIPFAELKAFLNKAIKLHATVRDF